MPDKDDEVFEHPSYCLASLSRTQATGTRLFASAITLHQNTVRLRIHTGVQLVRSNSGDRYYCKGKPDIEVEFSAAQFAEFVTTMNVGFGVPCTLRGKDGKRAPELPDVEPEAARQRGIFAKRMAEAAQKMAKHAAGLQAYLEASNIPKKHWRVLMDPVNSLIQEVGQNSPFWLELFEEATEKVIQTAKAEVDAFTTAAIHRTGIKVLREAPSESLHDVQKRLSKENE